MSNSITIKRNEFANTPTGQLKYLKALHLQQKHPAFPAVEIIAISRRKKYTDKTANGLTSMIVDYITYSGGFATRQQSQGQWNKRLKRFTKSSTKKGVSDITGVLCGVAINIEVKIGKDTQRKEQQQVQQQIQAAGGSYYIAKDFTSTYDYLNSIIETHTKTQSS